MSSESFVHRVRESTRLSWFLALLFFVCALLSKMTSVVLPALLLLIELFRGHKLHALSKPKRALAQAPSTSKTRSTTNAVALTSAAEM